MDYLPVIKRNFRDTRTKKMRRRLLAVILAGTALVSGSFFLFKKKDSAPSDADIKEQQALSGYKYTPEQARRRVLSTRNELFRYPERNKELSALFAKCAQTDYSAKQVPKESMELWKNMQRLKNSNTLLGPTFADFSVQANIFFCHTDTKEYEGTWSDDTGIIKVASEESSQDFHLLVETHETLHAIQMTTGAKKRDMAWSIEEFQINTLSFEAAAFASEYLVAIDLYQKGTRGPWNKAREESLLVSAEIAETLRNALKKNTPYAQALAAAGKKGFEMQFKEQWWLDSYNNTVLKNYIELLVGNYLKAPSEEKYTLENARKTGWISPEFNFTSNLEKLPAYEERFGDNVKMQQAFDYAETVRLGKTLGFENPAYLKSKAQLERKENPYLGVDLADVHKILKDKKNKASPLKVMDCLAGPEPCTLKTSLQKKSAGL